MVVDRLTSAGIFCMKHTGSLGNVICSLQAGV